MYLADFTLYLIETIVFQMSFANFAVWEVQAASTQSVGGSPHTAVTTRGIYTIPHVLKCKYTYNHT